MTAKSLCTDRAGVCFGVMLAFAAIVHADERLPESLLGVASGVGHALLVDKEAEKLFLFEQRPDRPPRQLRVWNATTGQGSGDKTVEGDLKTPEGIYFFTEILEDDQLPAEYGVRALVTDYPNLFDRRAGKTGDGIWVHGTDELVRPLTPKRTRGCVVVTNRDMDELTPYVDLMSSPIVVHERIRWLTLHEWRTERGELHEFVSTWHEAWRTSDFDTYGQLYGRRFRSDGKDRGSWLAHKRAVAGATDLRIGSHRRLWREDALAGAPCWQLADHRRDVAVTTGAGAVCRARASTRAGADCRHGGAAAGRRSGDGARTGARTGATNSGFDRRRRAQRQPRRSDR